MAGVLEHSSIWFNHLPNCVFVSVFHVVVVLSQRTAGYSTPQPLLGALVEQVRMNTVRFYTVNL